MKARIVLREDMPQLVDVLIRAGYEVVAPFRDSRADTRFGLVTEDNRDGIMLHGPNPLYPPKRFLLPHIQRLMTMRQVDGSFQIEETVAERRLAVLGIRSCDVAAIIHLDRYYLGGHYRDVYYERLRQGLFIVNLVCTIPGEDIGPDCFCVCTDTGPSAREGFDWQLTDLGDRLLVVAGTATGEAMFGDPVFRKGSDSDVAERRALLTEARRRFSTRTSWFSGAVRAVSQGSVPDDTWEEIGNRCLECGGCTFVCPACTCFTVTDREAGSGRHERVRVWDSCALAGFTRMAGGFNPRRAVHDRRNRRFFRKLSHYFVQRELSVACVGCGRCAAVCHGDIGMPTVVEMIRRGVNGSKVDGPADH